MATFCPYCDREIEDAINTKWVENYSVYFEFRCPKCGNVMDVSVEEVPCFIPTKLRSSKP